MNIKNRKPVFDDIRFEKPLKPNLPCIDSLPFVTLIRIIEMHEYDMCDLIDVTL